MSGMDMIRSAIWVRIYYHDIPELCGFLEGDFFFRQ